MFCILHKNCEKIKLHFGPKRGKILQVSKCVKVTIDEVAFRHFWEKNKTIKGLFPLGIYFFTPKIN